MVAISLFFCTFVKDNMARKLSKKKISGWLLLFAVIIFFRCGGSRKTVSILRSCKNKPEKTAVRKPVEVDKTLAHRLDSFVTHARRIGTLGVYVWDETANKEVYAYNADSLMRPASNMKMLTCITALRILGPNFRFRSGVYTRGEVKKDTLYGDIGFKFDFDPQFNPDSIARLADCLKNLGIKAVKGKVIVDMAIKEPMQHEEHWTIGDLKARKLGILYRGSRRVMPELKYVLRSKGISFADAQAEEVKLPKGMKKVGEISTPVTYPIMRALLNSSNENAECLYYPLAGKLLVGDDYRSAGNARLKRFIRRELNVHPDSVAVIHDACGLCIHDRLSPRFLVRLFHYAYAHKYINNVLRTFLPVPGSAGTLLRRMNKPELKGRIQAKTGTLTRENGLTSLAGYAKGSNGHLLLFAVIQNGLPVADARLWQDRFCTELVK
jgi:D-alanyl-D-alanine carboxypeptidase/D-alanyl-D-alanine-endopeptidase (penicillin-binding protein 4)